MSSPIDHMLPKDWDDWSPGEKETFFRENAEDVEHKTITKPLSRKELEDAQQELSIASVDLRKKEREYDKVKEKWREEIIKPRKEKVDVLLDQLENEAEEMEGNVFLLRDFQREMVYEVLADGTVINARPMMHKEKQFKTQSHMRSAAVNDNPNE